MRDKNWDRDAAKEAKRWEANRARRGRLNKNGAMRQIQQALQDSGNLRSIVYALSPRRPPRKGQTNWLVCQRHLPGETICVVESLTNWSVPGFTSIFGPGLCQNAKDPLGKAASWEAVILQVKRKLAATSSAG
jgi:hypothetical protein